MGTTSGPALNVNGVELRTVTRFDAVDKQGNLLGSFEDWDAAKAFAELVSPSTAPRTTQKLTREHRDSEWTYTNSIGEVSLWRYNDGYWEWRYPDNKAHPWRHSKYSEPSTSPALGNCWTEVVVREPRKVYRLTEEHRDSEWIRASGSRYRWNADRRSWEFKDGTWGWTSYASDTVPDGSLGLTRDHLPLVEVV